MKNLDWYKQKANHIRIYELIISEELKSLCQDTFGLHPRAPGTDLMCPTAPTMAICIIRMPAAAKEKIILERDKRKKHHV